MGRIFGLFTINFSSCEIGAFGNQIDVPFGNYKDIADKGRGNLILIYFLISQKFVQTSLNKCLGLYLEIWNYFCMWKTWRQRGEN